MARIRSIKPEFWIDEKIVDLDPWARLLFIGIWNFADDQGYIDNKPRRIKMQVFPGDNVDVDTLLGMLVKAELLAEYESPIGPVLYVRSWLRHQRVDKASAPRFSPDELVPSRTAAGSRDLVLSATARPTGAGNVSELLFDDPSLGLASPPVVLATDLEGKGSGSGKDLERIEEPSSADASETDGKKRRASAADDEPDGFAEFYDRTYPRKDDRIGSRKAYAKATKVITVAELLTFAAQYRELVRVQRRDRQHILLPTTWLNNQRWNDDMTLPLGARAPASDSRHNVSTEEQHKQNWGSDAEVV